LVCENIIFQFIDNEYNGDRISLQNKLSSVYCQQQRHLKGQLVENKDKLEKALIEYEKAIKNKKRQKSYEKKPWQKYRLLKQKEKQNLLMKGDQKRGNQKKLTNNIVVYYN
jgi:hypothetical protein